MKTTPDTPLDPLGSLGAPIRQSKPTAAPVPVAPGIVSVNGKLQTTEKPQPLIDWRYGNPIGAPIVHQDDAED